MIFDAPYNRDIDDGDGDGKTRPKPRVRLSRWKDWRQAFTKALLGHRDGKNSVGCGAWCSLSFSLSLSPSLFLPLYLALSPTLLLNSQVIIQRQQQAAGSSNLLPWE